MTVTYREGLPRRPRNLQLSAILQRDEDDEEFPYLPGVSFCLPLASIDCAIRHSSRKETGCNKPSYIRPNLG